MGWREMADSLLDRCTKTFDYGGITYQPVAVGDDSSSPDAFTVAGVFDAAHLSLQIHDGVEYSTVGPTLGVRLSDFQVPPAQGDIVLIDDTTSYEVIDVQPDGQGGALLVLRTS